MSDSGRVTITLGRSGQVVKRDLSSADVSYASSLSLAGTKRSVRDRIGNNVDGYGHSNNKRHRGDNSIQNGFDDGRIDKDDLRLKLMRKSASKRAESNGDKSQIDLREKLTKAVRSPMTSFNSKQRELEPRETSMIRRIPSARSSDDLMRMESMRSSYSPWTLDHIRRRSPDGFPSSSRRISPQRNVEDLQRRPLNRTYESVTPVPYVTRDVESSRPPGTTPASFAARSTMSTLPPVTAKPVTSHLGQLPPSSSVAQRASYVGDEQQSHQTVDGLLHALGLGKYAILFKAEEVDMTALKQMGEHDLKELGIPMGPRKKILLALLPRAKRQQ
ncbi:hypothetical protein HN51_069366 [Arachis hypogaea]|uniref:SAM domain-containing protein n=1 Tax=Arachis hypogaea TaxID=3818 RepID=A0A444Z6F5_ARAHY|nr:uncharacterized protein LOC107643492 isoform X1 [Arachis ipaensis]XP_025654405.1 uncharacterized protein LOC112750087 [Arachis hypogaea]QHO11631.1 SEC23-interacting protein [Arachis hypogaea]RYR09753.1 hypothetical protein Ahy_B05g078159 [Arachis hypogaea]